MKVISSFVNKVAYLIHNGTLTLVYYLLDIHVLFLKTVYFHLRFLFKSDFRMSCFVNNGEMIVKRLKLEKRRDLPHY